ncbi:hypothetical protein XENOCAPTIV_004304 [Xenoophorus captivus]|uniref:Uncharacterized protein n=1 Tax=Xenoophorus captivus TaxID=1517983 RepID=A0ABV0QDJ0_9TELE
MVHSPVSKRNSRLCRVRIVRWTLEDFPMLLLCLELSLVLVLLLSFVFEVSLRPTCSVILFYPFISWPFLLCDYLSKLIRGATTVGRLQHPHFVLSRHFHMKMTRMDRGLKAHKYKDKVVYELKG